MITIIKMIDRVLSLLEQNRRIALAFIMLGLVLLVVFISPLFSHNQVLWWRWIRSFGFYAMILLGAWALIIIGDRFVGNLCLSPVVKPLGFSKIRGSYVGTYKSLKVSVKVVKYSYGRVQVAAETDNPLMREVKPEELPRLMSAETAELFSRFPVMRTEITGEKIRIRFPLRFFESYLDLLASVRRDLEGLRR